MAVNSSEEGQDACRVAVLPDEGTTQPQCESRLASLRLWEVSKPFKTQLCLDAQSNCQNHINLEMENAGAYFPCIVDIDIEKGKSVTPKIIEETIGNLNYEDTLNRMLQGQIKLQIGGKFVQLLMNHSLMLPKFTSRDKRSVAERVHEGPNNRLRKYKRSASFNSRKVVLLFSVLSSMGTLILIYLALRVRQIGDGAVRV